MKSSRGLTFIEVMTALGIMAILLPVVGIVFYNLIVIPPDQSARLKLNNEIALLSSYLFRDGNLAENFTPGTFPLSPYYGNFSWTDYSNGSYPTFYLVSYYATCPNVSDTSCNNHIVRQVNLTNGSTLPTPTPTPTATPTPTPTPTAIAATQTYTYCAEGGTYRLAWAKAWTNAEWFTSGRPTSPDNYFDASSRTLVDADVSAYSSLCNADNLSWSNLDTTPPLDYGVGSQLYQILVYQNRSDVTNLSVTWRGYGGAFTQYTKLKIWNYVGSSWYTLFNASDPGSKTIGTYTNSITSSPLNYIDPSTNYVTLLASSDTNNVTPEDTNFGTALQFNGSDNKVTTSSTVPTDTFTFEAWVKAVNTHEIDPYLDLYGGTSGQCYVFGATHRGTNAGAGLSVGTNGMTVYEHGDSYMPSVAVYSGAVGTAWNHIAVVYSSKTPSIYLNGNLVATGSASPRTTVYAPYEIGLGSYGAFNGTIDEVRLWNVALTQTQIRTNMYREIPSPTSETNLVGYWQCSNNVSDISGHGNDGTLSTPPPQYVGSLSRDVTVYTDYIAMTVVTPGASPTPTPTIPPPAAPVTVSFKNTSVGTTTWTVPSGVSSAEVLVVAGGGGGGGSSIAVYCGGGGGAGGVLYDASYAVTPGQTITITVGDKGTGGGPGGVSAVGTNGGNSVFGSMTATGGGCGGGGGSTVSSANRQGRNGGSGGGEAVQTTSGTSTGGTGTAGPPRQGYDGGSSYYYGLWIWDNSAGGGGGAGANGGNGGTDWGGAGGAGVSTYSALLTAVSAGVDISGTRWIAGGGGGSAYSNGGSGGNGGGGAGGSRTNGVAATANTGGGGGGGADGSKSGGNGGTGIVVVRYTQLGEETLTTSMGAGGATVLPAPPGANYQTGSVVPINASPATCYTFVNWTGDTGTIADVNSNSTTITMSSDYSIQANFAPITSYYNLSLTADPPAGGYPSYNGSSPFACGFNISINANPNPGYYFGNWTPTAGVANPNASDTTVQMTVNRSLIAHYSLIPVPTPTPTPPNYLTSMYLTWHVKANNFSLQQSRSASGNIINASMTAGINTSMGKYIQKQLTIYVMPRPAYLLPVENIWGYDTVSSLRSFRISGALAVISGDVKVNGTVTVVSSASGNRIDGTLTCPTIVGDDSSKLSYTSRITGNSSNTMPTRSLTTYIGTNLSAGIETYDDVNHEYIFFRDINLHTDSIARTRVWQGGDPDSNHTLKPGVYYSNGTITLADTYTKGTVTFIANRIVIQNNANTGLITGIITLAPYASDELLFWGNGSAGTPTGGFDGDILIWDTNPVGGWSNHACVSLEGVLYAPNGEIELAGSGRTGWFGYTDSAELYNGALVTKDLTISGSHWNFYRW